MVSSILDTYNTKSISNRFHKLSICRFESYLPHFLALTIVNFAFSLLVRTVVLGTIRDGSIPSMHNKQCQFYKAVVQWLGHRLIHIQYLMILTILYYILVKLGTYNRSSILLCLHFSYLQYYYFIGSNPILSIEKIISIVVNAIHFKCIN